MSFRNRYGAGALGDHRRWAATVGLRMWDCGNSRPSAPQCDAEALAGTSVFRGVASAQMIDELCPHPLVAHDTRRLLNDVLLVMRGRRRQGPAGS